MQSIRGFTTSAIQTAFWAKKRAMITGQLHLRMNDVTRDMSQGKYANRIPLNAPTALKIFKLWNELNQQGPANFGIIEWGGASVQVDENFLRRKFTQTGRDLRKAAPNTPIRPLWRGANSFLLKPAHPDDLFWILNQVASDVAPITAKENELLRVKVFDSQGQTKEVESTVAMVAKLQKLNHPVSVEVAIPYSYGEGRDTHNPYPDKLFINRILEAAELGKQYGIPANLFRVSLKDMVGELRTGKAGELVGTSIEALKSRGFNTELGLHLHDTGLALEAYVDAIKTCYQQSWPVNVDTVGGNNSGFVNTLELVAALRDSGLPLRLTSQQLETLKTIDDLQNQLREQYQAARGSEIFSGEDLRRYAIPGGGETSFINAVKTAGFAKRLKLSETDSLHVMGTALIAVGRLMGHAFPVTPGFQNKQIAAFNFVNNMIKASRMTLGDRQKTEKALLSKLQNEEVITLFLQDLDPVVKEFLKGDMPTPLHPTIQQQLGRRSHLLTDNQVSRLPQAKEVVKKLQAEGVVSNTEEAYKEAVTRALILDPAQFEAMERNPHWGREVNPTKFSNSLEWEKAKKRTADIRSAGVPDPYAEEASHLERYFGVSSDPKSWQQLVPYQFRGRRP